MARGSIVPLLAILLAGCATPGDPVEGAAEAPGAPADEPPPAADPETPPPSASPPPASDPAPELAKGRSSILLKETDVCTGSATAPIYCLGYSPAWGELAAKGEGDLELVWNATAEGFSEIAVFLVVPGGSATGRAPDGAGPSPISIDLGPVAKATYHVRFFPAGEARGPIEQIVDWRVLPT